MSNMDTEHPCDFGYSMHGMTGTARLVDELMKLDKHGNKNIVIAACYSGSETAMLDKDEHGETMQIDTESLVSQLGNDLATSGVGQRW